MNQKNMQGVGWSFPVRFSGNGASVTMAAGPADIAQALTIIFRTHMRERMLHLDFGLDTHRILFADMDQHLVSTTQHMVEQVLRKYEPRIRVDAVTVLPFDPPDGVLMIEVSYTIKETNSRHNQTFPYKLHEAITPPKHQATQPG